MKNRYKLTPFIIKQLEDKAIELPSFQRKDKHGKLMFRVMSRVVKGSELEPKTLVAGERVNPDKNYIQRGSEPILVNHKLNLLECYQKDGPDGVDEYVKFFKDEYERYAAEAAEKEKEAVNEK